MPIVHFGHKATPSRFVGYLEMEQREGKGEFWVGWWNRKEEIGFWGKGIQQYSLSMCLERVRICWLIFYLNCDGVGWDLLCGHAFLL